jgi:hypothetical protein
MEGNKIRQFVVSSGTNYQQPAILHPLMELTCADMYFINLLGCVLIQKVLSFQATSDVAKGGQQQQHQEESDGVSCSPGKLSFKCDVGSCSSVSASSALYSPLSLVSAPAKDAEQMLTPSRKHYCMSRLSSMSQHSASVLEPAIARMVYSSSSPKSLKSMEGEENCRMGQWITTDSDCELCIPYCYLSTSSLQ